MKKLAKLISFPIVTFGLFGLLVLLNWGITKLLAIVFNTTVQNIITTPMMFVYIVSTIGFMYLAVYACQVIDEEF